MLFIASPVCSTSLSDVKILFLTLATLKPICLSEDYVPNFGDFEAY